MLCAQVREISSVSGQLEYLVSGNPTDPLCLAVGECMININDALEYRSRVSFPLQPKILSMHFNTQGSNNNMQM